MCAAHIRCTDLLDANNNNKMITDAEIETHRIAGEITLVLKDGTDDEKQGLLEAIEKTSGKAERYRLENWMRENLEGS